MTSVPLIQDEPRAAIGAAPVSSEKPAGTDCRASAEYEAISDEVRKLDTEGPNSVDWAFVSKGSLSFIEHKSKDILVASWLAFALFRCEGLSGLTTGLAILNGLISVHWADAFPPKARERARVAALDWLSGRLVPAFTNQRFSDGDADQIVAIFDLFDQIDRDVSDKLTKESLNLVEMIRALRPHADQARRVLAEAAQKREDEIKRLAAEADRAANPAPEAPAASSANQAGAAPRASVSSAPIAIDLSQGADLDGLATMLWSASRDLHRGNPGNAHAYLLGRVASWLRIDALPEARGTTTMVVTPPEIETIEAAIAADHLVEALEAAEELAWTAPFCLDSYRLSYEILGKMDKGFEPARRTVQGFLTYLLTLHPKLSELTFSDGRAFAGEDTMALVDGVGSGGGGAEAQDAMDKAVTQARGLIAGGNAFDALDLLSQTHRRATSGRQRLLWHLAQARFCVEYGYTFAAVSLLDHLDAIAVERDLESWEPDLARQIADLRLRVLLHSDSQLLIAEERGRAALEATKGRLARLDIGAAARLLRPQ